MRTAMPLRLLAMASFCLGPDAASRAAAQTPTFQHHVRPIFAAKCVACHGGKQTKARLDLRTLESTLKGGKSGPIVAGKIDDSLLWQRIDAAEMPPKGQPLLSEVERAVIRRWIEQGKFAGAAKPRQRGITEQDRSFWSFRKPVKAPTPAVKDAQRIRTPIDAFVLQKLQEKGLTLNPDASREKLIRRLCFDVVGLPPSPAEIDAFVGDTAPDAYEKLVDRLLASPQHGERWARHWLDVAGYADSNGRRGDEERRSSWRYRDWVIRALNADMPYDQFVREQLAGDELVDWRNAETLTPAMVDKLVATGFLRCAPDATDNEMVDERDDRFETLHDTVEIAARALLGLTVGCAKCHDHKYDPILQADFYRLEACFQPAYNPDNWLPANKRSFRDDNLRYLPEATPKQLAAWQTRVKPIDAAIAKVAERLKKSPKDAAVKNELDALKARRPAAPRQLWALWDLSPEPPPTYLLKRGDFKSPGDRLRPGVLAVLDQPAQPFVFPESDRKLGTTGRRRTLAEWITRPDHPLTARVIVNRIWQHHFGKGIVRTPDDFGAEGARPTHPELLDWLAVRFVEDGWSLRKLHRLILLSSVYRQAADFDPARPAIDPTNELLWRKAPLRLEAEALRDAILAVSGALNPQQFGEPVPVKQAPDGQFMPVGSEANRRSIYLLNVRSESMTFLNVFDAPVMELNCPERFNSTVPLQALSLMNNPFVVAEAKGFAMRVRKFAGDDHGRQVRTAYRLALGRLPGADELAQAQHFLTRPDSLTNFCQVLLATNEFLYVD
jgi:hypothetical protein